MLSLNTATVRKQWNLAQIIDGCARHDIRGISPWRDQVATMGLNEARKSIQANGLTVTGLCRGGFFTAKEWRDDNRRAIEEAHALGAQCDWLVPTRDLLNDRGMMGDGVIDLPRIRSWVEGAGYSGFHEVEIFSELDWWQRDPDEVLRTCKERHSRCT